MNINCISRRLYSYVLSISICSFICQGENEESEKPPATIPELIETSFMNMNGSVESREDTEVLDLEIQGTSTTAGKWCVEIQGTSTTADKWCAWRYRIQVPLQVSGLCGDTGYKYHCR